MKHFFLFLFILVGAFSGQSQVIFSDPPFINPESSIQLIFDASKGNEGLKDCNCDVYLHTGVITSKSNGLSDWKYVQGVWGQIVPTLKMTSIGDNKYIFTMTPRSFYGVPQDEELDHLAFVFRNGDGSKAGRADGGGDIYLDVVSPSAGLQVILQQPSSTVILEEGQSTISITAHSSQEATWKITDASNMQEVDYTPNGSTLLNYDLPIIRDGEVVHTVTMTATFNGEEKDLSFKYVVVADTEIADPDIDTPPGFTLMPNGKLRLKLVAPGKANVQVLTNFNDFKINNDSQMKKSISGDYFWIDMDATGNTDWLMYQYLVDASITIADPMSTNVLDPWNDNEINNDYFPSYPSGAEGIVTIEKISGHSYSWTDQNYTRPQQSNLVVYEVLIRDFLAAHSFNALTDTLDYLKRLGINAIELMPVNEFEGNNSWGYNPSFHKALDKYYGDPIDFKNFVNAAHDRGIAVIIDVVYNHAFSQSPLCQLYWDDANFKPNSDNPWLNVDAKHPFNVGYDFNHESAYTRQWVKDVQRFWLEEYHIDGFRLDLSKGFTQRNNPNDIVAWNAYDASRLAILKDYADDLWSVDADAYIILEHLGDGGEERELADYGMMLWGNVNHNYGEAVMGFTATSGLAGGLHTSRGFNDPHLVAYMESHDEERNMYRALNFGNSNANYSTQEFDTAIDRMKLANTFFLTLPGPKMIWQFGELGYDFSINQCQNGGINTNCRLDKKPIRWDYAESDKRLELFTHIKQLLGLRKEYNLSTVDNIKQLLSGSVKKVELRKGNLLVFIVGNFDIVEKTTNLEFSQKTEWKEIFTNTIADNSVDPVSVNLAPGEFRVYTNQDISVNNEVVESKKIGLKVFPNPSSDILNIEADALIYLAEIYDLKGKKVSTQIVDKNKINLRLLDIGIYALVLHHEQGVTSTKFIKQ